ncbi:melanoma cell adhesion molecule b isoform 2-T2 [Odontesthes bonariensis]|uniref:melanoma cell adhesion molecule b isoform X3 n=1 Tax=Odontesthes bonariensis TaxID=219752 RepID=UPI003F589DE2
MALRDTASRLLGLLVLLHTWGAWADVEVNMEDKVEVFSQDTAQITCMFTSAEGIGGTNIQWFYVSGSKDKQRIYFQDSIVKSVDKGTPFTDRISMNGTGATGAVVLTISNVQLTDEGEFICIIKSLTEGTGEGRTKLRVFAIPDDPTIEGVQTGISVNDLDASKIGSCEVRKGYPKPNITWYKNSTPLRNAPGAVGSGSVLVSSSTTTESSGLYSVISSLRMRVKKEDKNAEFYCEVTYFVPGATMMKETARINVTVYYLPTAVNIWVESPKGKIKEGDTVDLHCTGNGNSPSSVISIKYLKDDISWDTNEKLLENVTRHDSGVYACTSQDMETFDEILGNVTVFVNYLDTAVVIPEESVVVDKGGDLKATCNALSSLQTVTEWSKNGHKVSDGHSLILKNATFDTAGTYSCVVTVVDIEGMETSGELRVHVQGAPEIIKKDSTEIVTSEKAVELSCQARGYPSPTITWTTSDGKVIKSTSETETEEGAQSVVSVKVASNITAYCNASNEHGTDLVTFNIKVKTKSNGFIIAIVIIFVLLLAILGSVLYFLYKKGKICGRSGKQDLTKERSSKDNIVVEMKSDNTEEAILLGVNGEKQPPNDQ